MPQTEQEKAEAKAARAAKAAEAKAVRDAEQADRDSERSDEPVVSTKDYTSPQVKAAEELVVKAEKDKENAQDAVDAAAETDVNDVVAEQAEIRKRAANTDEERANIDAAEKVRIETEAKVQTNDPDV